MSTKSMSAMVFELRYRVEASRKVGIDRKGKEIWEMDKERMELLPASPAHFKRLTGTYREVSAEATRLNGVQLKSGFQDYLFYPDPLGPTRLA